MGLKPGQQRLNPTGWGSQGYSDAMKGEGFGTPPQGPEGIMTGAGGPMPVGGPGVGPPTGWASSAAPGAGIPRGFAYGRTRVLGGGPPPGAQNQQYAGQPYLSGQAAAGYANAGLNPAQVAQRQAAWAQQYGGGDKGAYLSYLHNQDTDNAREAKYGIAPERVDTQQLGNDAFSRNNVLFGGNRAAYKAQYGGLPGMAGPGAAAWLKARQGGG